MAEHQTLNYTLCADFSAYIRQIEPQGVTVSLGGEIGEVGGKNSTEEELRAYMDGYLAELKKRGNYPGISKISIQTGTSHGGTVLPDGTLAQVSIDFDVLARLSDVARKEYGMAGAVQHGASTLPEQAFVKFVEAGACEVHLATGFQNTVYESRALPEDFKQRIYDWLRQNAADERKPSDTEEQFLYKTRKKAWGVFKADFWNLPADTRAQLSQELENQFAFLFERLNVLNTRDLVNRLVRPVELHQPRPELHMATELANVETAHDLAD